MRKKTKEITFDYLGLDKVYFKNYFANDFIKCVVF